MELPTQFELTECRTGQSVLATIDRLDREIAKKISVGWIDTNWWSITEELTASIDDQPDYHWDWVALVSKIQHKPMSHAVFAKTPDGKIQGAMLHKNGVDSALEPSEKAIFVDRLASAPANRPELVMAPEFRGAGEGLLRYAIAESWSLGLHGRVSMFPIAHEDFYVKRGFQPTSVRDQSGSDTLYEISSTDAEKYLRHHGVL